MIRNTKVTSTLTLATLAVFLLAWSCIKARAADSPHTESVAWAITLVETYSIACQRLPLAFLRAVDALQSEVKPGRLDHWAKKIVRDSIHNPKFCVDALPSVERIRATMESRILYQQCLINEHEHKRLHAKRFCSILHPFH